MNEFKFKYIEKVTCNFIAKKKLNKIDSMNR